MAGMQRGQSVYLVVIIIINSGITSHTSHGHETRTRNTQPLCSLDHAPPIPCITYTLHPLYSLDHAPPIPCITYTLHPLYSLHETGTRNMQTV